MGLLDLLLASAPIWSTFCVAFMGFGWCCCDGGPSCQRCAAPIEALSVTIGGLSSSGSLVCDCDSMNATYLLPFREDFSSTNICVFCVGGGGCTPLGHGVGVSLVFSPASNPRVQVGVTQTTSAGNCAAGGAVVRLDSLGDPCRLDSGGVTATLHTGSTVCQEAGSTAPVELA